MAESQPTIILLVEDDPNIQEIYKTVLASSGYNVRAVISGDQALREIEQKKPEFVLLDLMIPGIPGIDVLKTLRTEPKFTAMKPQPRVVVITNVADPEMAKTAKQLGVARYIIKAEISASDLPKILKRLENSAAA